MIIVIAVLVLIVSAVVSNQINFQKTPASPTPSPSSLPSPTPTSSPIPTPSATVIIKQEVGDLSNFKYPNSSQVGSLENGIKLESSDDPKVITDWYEEKIRSLGFKSKSFVKTNTNGQVLNKLVAASAEKEVRVEIAKSAGSTKVLITVTAT